MANTTQYKYSPRIFGKTGDQYLAMQPSIGNGLGGAHYMSPEEDVPVIDYGNGGAVPTGLPPQGLDQQPVQFDESTPYGKAQADNARVAAYLKTKPQQTAPERFVPNVPNPTVLPPPAPYNTDPAVNTLLKLYPWLSLFGGVRGASAVTTGAAEGIGIHAQAEEQRLAQQRAYQQQALDEQYQRDLKNQEIQAETNRYYNQATNQSNVSNEAYWKAGLGGVQGQAKLSDTELSRQRRESTRRIGDLRHELTSPWTSWPRALQILQSLDREKVALRDQLGGPETGSELQNVDDLQKNFINEATKLASQQAYGTSHLEQWGNIQKSLLGIKGTEQENLQKARFTFEGRQRQLDRQVKQANNTWQYFGIQSANWRAALNKETELIKLDRDLKAKQMTVNQNRNFKEYEAKRNAYLDAQHRFTASKNRIDAFYKAAANAGHNYQPDPAQAASIAQEQAGLDALQKEVEETGQDAAAAREILSLPTKEVPPPPAASALGTNGPIQPNPPSDSGSRGEAGAGTRSQQPGGRKRPTTSKRNEIMHTSPAPAAPAATTKQKVHNF